MKIAFVYDIPYPWHRGGAEQIFNVESREMAKKHDVDFFTMRWKGMKEDFFYENVHYHALGEPITERDAYKHGRRAIREALYFALHVREIFKYDFDVVITNAFPILHLPLIKAYCRAKNAKLVVKVDEVWDHKYWQNYLGIGIGSVANAYANMLIRSRRAMYVANSSITARGLEGLGIERRRISRFAPVLEDKILSDIRRSSRVKKNRIIFSGRFIKEKRIDKWLLAVDAVRKEGFEFEALLIGDGIEREDIERRIDEMRLGDLVKVRPFFKDKRDLYKTIAESKVLLHMGEREGLGIIALESIALGTSVVIPEYSPMPEEVKNMCIVEKEGNIPKQLIRIMKSRGEYNKPDIKNLKMFSTSNVVSFYEKLLNGGN